MTQIIEEHLVVHGGNYVGGKTAYPQIVWEVADMLPAKFRKDLETIS